MKKIYYRVSKIHHPEFDYLIIEDFEEAMKEVADQIENAEPDESVTIEVVEMTAGQYAALGVEEWKRDCIQKRQHNRIKSIALKIGVNGDIWVVP